MTRNQFALHSAMWKPDDAGAQSVAGVRLKVFVNTLRKEMQFIISMRCWSISGQAIVGVLNNHAKTKSSGLLNREPPKLDPLVEPINITDAKIFFLCREHSLPALDLTIPGKYDFHAILQSPWHYPLT